MPSGGWGTVQPSVREQRWVIFSSLCLLAGSILACEDEIQSSSFHSIFFSPLSASAHTSPKLLSASILPSNPLFLFSLLSPLRLFLSHPHVEHISNTCTNNIQFHFVGLRRSCLSEYYKSPFCLKIYNYLRDYWRVQCHTLIHLTSHPPGLTSTALPQHQC